MTTENKLKNGATVLERSGDVVLAKQRLPDPAPYVMWRVDGDDNAYWGHYFLTLVEAAQDFAERTEVTS